MISLHGGLHESFHLGLINLLRTGGRTKDLVEGISVGTALNFGGLFGLQGRVVLDVPGHKGFVLLAKCIAVVLVAGHGEKGAAFGWSRLEE